MSLSVDSVKLNKKLLFQVFIAIIFLEGLISAISVILIPADPKNAVLWGYSLYRLAILVTLIFGLGIQVFFFINSEKALKRLEPLFMSTRFIHWVKWTGIVGAIFLWLTLWTPMSRLGVFGAEFVRIKPLLLWIELIIFQSYIFVKLVLNEINIKENFIKDRSNSTIIRVLFFIVLIGAGLFELLRIFTPGVTSNQLLFPPGAPLSSLQLFLAWLLFVVIYLLEQKNGDAFHKKTRWVFIAFLIIWLSTFLIWNAVPLTCTDDRPGPYLPNNQCYPTINDAVYTIGSHYTALGQGIYNHWQTDKPLYMFFLAIGQWISGPRIDQYLVFQVAILALIPALLFLAGKRFFGYAGGIFLAILAMLFGMNEIRLYQMVGSVNAKLENPELLTALLLILFCFAVFKWFNQPNKPIWAALSGGVLGLSSLVRVNPIFIAPVLLLVVGITGFKKRNSLFMEIFVFIVAFLLVFSPMILTAQDSMGNNYYLAKIQNVISERYSDTNLGSVQPSQQATQPISTQSLSPTDGNQNGLVYPPPEVIPPTNNGSSILIHLLNNEYSALVILPTTMSFLSINDQVKQPIWNFKYSDPIWNADLSLENIFVLFLNFIVIVLGVYVSYNKFGVAGFSALLIQFGYDLGNAISKTSGGRYLEPVNWVTLLYFSIGFISITLFVFKMLSPKKAETSAHQFEKVLEKDDRGDLPQKKLYLRLSGLAGIFLIIGLSLPLVSYLPSLLPEETSSNIDQIAEKIVENNGITSVAKWTNFINDPDHLVVRGKVYDAQYYRSAFYQSGNLSFEMMLLGKEHVVVSYLLGVKPNKPFADGSDVILVGCKLGQDNRWSADRIIMRSFAVIQLDHERSIYGDPNATWQCSK